MAAPAALSPAGRVPPGDVLEREQHVAMDERRRRLRDAVDRTAVGVEQDRRAGRRRCPGFDGAEERVDAGARERRGDVVRLRRVGRAANAVSEPAVQGIRAARPEQHRVEVGQRTDIEAHRCRAGSEERREERLELRGRPEELAARADARPARVRRLDGEQREELVRRLRCPALPGVDDPRRVRPGPHGAEGRRGAHRVRLEREARGDAKVPAAPAPAGPEEIGVALGIALPDDPVRGHHREAPEVVAGEAELAAGEPDPSSQGEARDADRRARSGGDRDAPGCELAVDVHQPRAGTDRLPSRPPG